MKRPVGISALVLLLLANGIALTGQAAVCLLQDAAFPKPLLNIYPASWMDALGIFFPILGAFFSLAAAAGLWWRREEARVGLIFTAAAPLAYYAAATAIGLLADPGRVGQYLDETVVLRGLVLVFVVVYLTRRHVKRAFGLRDRFFAEFDAVPEYDPSVLLEYERQMEEEAVSRADA
jgi:hypothetical protein